MNTKTLHDNLTLSTIIPMFPLLLAEGVYTRQKVPRIGEAAGPNSGIIHGQGDPIRLAMIGESTIAGVCAKTYEQGLAGQTAVYLHNQTNRPIHWQAIGKNGIQVQATRTDLLPQLNQKPDFVFIGLGVNDVTHFASRHSWQTHLRGLFQDLHLAWGNVPIIMSGMPPMHQFPALPQPLRWYLGKRAAILDRLTRAVCGDFYHVSYLPIPPLPTPDYFCIDQFHPSELGYKAWGEWVGTAVLEQALV